MPKVKWGDALDQESIENAESRSGDYTGELPPSGIYRFKIRYSKKAESNEGKPKLVTMLVLDGSWNPKHKKYDGCPMWEHMPVSNKAAFRVRAYCDALNISAGDFMNKMVVDDEGYVQKIGKLKIADEDLLVLCKVAVEKSEEYGDKLGFGKSGGYLPYKDEDEDDDTDDDTDTDGGDDSDDDSNGPDPF